MDAFTCSVIATAFGVAGLVASMLTDKPRNTIRLLSISGIFSGLSLIIRDGNYNPETVSMVLFFISVLFAVFGMVNLAAAKRQYIGIGLLLMSVAFGIWWIDITFP